ncbi:hypothetical protein [Variovorax sp. PCZ-1]|uniref:hypothetical protein n=1 Tax=Variovorax sp. PCZ-1 TaxID=2835533 RepID=UPI001BCBB346|nr:hypothetical protein [Variovorax sp. PCZ-1]MBS7806536.1 hypothetical protein [Variovorax sp. PCZ-1]
MSPTSCYQQRFHHALMAMSFAALALAVFFPMLSDFLPHIPTSGHSHVHAHGHAFVDARSFWGIPNGWDVLTNVPFLFAGVWGLVVLRRRTLPNSTRKAAQIFFIGLILTCFGSSVYHWAPSDFGLMIDRLGMAIAFAGVIAFAAGSRLGESVAKQAMPVLLVLAPLAAVAAHSLQNVLPWAVVQFGGVLMIGWLATLPQREGQSLNLWALILWYGLAKLLEAQDEAVFHLTQGVVSGHSLKHLAACMAAWPVIAALKKS